MTAKLVAIGDSLTQGFQHGSIRRPMDSYPAMVAGVLGAPAFRQGDFFANGNGGPVLDIERLCHTLSDHYGSRVPWYRVLGALIRTRSFMGKVEDYWERGQGTKASPTGPLHHNLAVWGFEVLDALTLTDALCAAHTPDATNDFIAQIVEFGMYRTARRVLNPSTSASYEGLSQLGCASEIARREGGIENLLVALGANNALPTCVHLKVHPSDPADLSRLPHERKCTVWRPADFRPVYDRIEALVQAVRPERVFLATVPHVTIAPVTRGVSPSSPGSPLVGKYYEYYTRFWIWDRDFRPGEDPALTRGEARHVDGIVDEYNHHIRTVAGRNGWVVIDFAKMLDELAFRRHGGMPSYAFPVGLVAALRENPLTSFRVRPDGTVLLDTRFFRVPLAPPLDENDTGKWQTAYKGGLFGLDGVHPTTIGYGLMAEFVLRTMQCAGVPGADGNNLD